MYCIHCGKEIPDGASFCIHCGKKQIVEVQPSAETYNQQEEDQTIQSEVQSDQQNVPPPEQDSDTNTNSATSAEPSNQQESPSFKELAKELKDVGSSVLNCEGETRNDTICPFCGADNCQPMQKTTTETNIKGYGWGSGCCGMLLLGPFGLLCGLCGAGSKSKTSSELWLTCMKCGKQHLALADGLKKWDNSVSMVLLSACIMGILFLIVRYMELGIIGLIFELGFVIAPPLGLYGLHEEVSEELGVPILDYLTPEQKKTSLWTALGAMAIVLIIGLFGLSILENILGE